MKSIKKLPQTRAKVIKRSDGVRQRYWVGRKPNTLKKHPNWKNKGFKALKKAGFKGQPYTDSDGDGKVNTFDCKPLDATRQEDSNEVLELIRKEIPNVVKVKDNFGADYYYIPSNVIGKQKSWNTLLKNGFSKTPNPRYLKKGNILVHNPTTRASLIVEYTK